MSLDHEPFINKYQVAEPSSFVRKHGPLKFEYASVFIALVFATFVGFFIYINQWSPLDESARNIGGIAVIAFLMTAYFVFHIIRYARLKNRQYQHIYKVLKHSRSARLIVDSNGKTLFVNDHFKKLCPGEEGKDLKALKSFFQPTPESYERLLWLESEALKGHEQSATLLCKRDQRERWLTVLVQPVLEADGIVHWSIDDMSDQYIHDSAIRDEREKLIDFTDHAPVGFFSLDEHGRFVFANATLARWLGQDINVLLENGHIHHYLVTPPQNAKPYDITDDGGARQVGEMRMKGAAGQTFLASINQTVVHEPDGGIRTRGVVNDLTSEREMRRALKASQDRFETFFTEAPIGIIQLDTNRTIVDCNQSFADMMGLPQGKIDGRNFPSLITPENKKYVIATLDSLSAGKNVSFPVEVSFISKGDPLTAQMYARQLGEDGNMVLHLINVTEKKVLEEQFVQSQKMQAVGQLAGGVAHDFNNLLTAIIGFSDLLLLRHKPGDPSFADIMQIKQNSNRAANLVKQLLAFSRQQTLRVKVQDVTDILVELSHLIRRLIGAGIDFDLTHGQELGLVKVDEGQMEQVLINLAVNARDAMDGKGKLHIETQNFVNDKTIELVSEDLPPGEWVKITVSDTGCGIDKKNMARIFEPFFTTKDIGEGTGLGLSTVYGIVRQTGGFLTAESAKGKGSKFIIYLPRAEEQDDEKTDVQTSKQEVTVKDLTGSECILLVEDEDAVRTFSERALTNKGYHVMSASSGENALELLKDPACSPIDLVVTDVFMPGMDGPTLAQRLRQNNKDLKIIFVSGYTEDKLKGHLGKNTHFIPKPYTLKVLAEKVKDVLAE